MTGPTTPAEADEKPPPTLFSRSNMGHDQEADNAEMRRENEFMAHEIGEMHKELAELRKALPTPEEVAFLREKKRADENAAWMWRMVKTHAPWVTVVASMIGSGVYWALTHTITIGSKP